MIRAFRNAFGANNLPLDGLVAGSGGVKELQIVTLASGDIVPIGATGDAFLGIAHNRAAEDAAVRVEEALPGLEFDIDIDGLISEVSLHTLYGVTIASDGGFSLNPDDTTHHILKPIAVFTSTEGRATARCRFPIIAGNQAVVGEGA